MQIIVTLRQYDNFRQKKADVELINLHDLPGLKLAGFQIVEVNVGTPEIPNLTLNVWFPSNTFQKGKSTGRYWYLRSMTADNGPVDALTAEILTAYHAQVAAGGKPVARAARPAAPKPEPRVVADPLAQLRDAAALTPGDPLPPRTVPPPVTSPVTPTPMSEPHIVGTDAPTPENDPVGRFRAVPPTAPRKPARRRRKAAKRRKARKPRRVSKARRKATRRRRKPAARRAARTAVRG